jgi:hypothetical protein
VVGICQQEVFSKNKKSKSFVASRDQNVKSFAPGKHASQLNDRVKCIFSTCALIQNQIII